MDKMRRVLLAVVVAVVAVVSGCSTQSAENRAASGGKAADLTAVRQSCEAALRRGAESLLKSQKADGSFGGPADAGKAALALSAILGSPDGKQLRDTPAVKKGIEFLLKMRQPDGSINPAGEKGLANYQTSAALCALVAFGDPEQAEIRKAAAEFLLSIQNRDDTNQGSWGYNRDKRGDLSNTQFALEALRAAGLDEKSEAFKNCLVFLQRCQNRSESNDQPWATNDGGGIYLPGRSNAGIITLPNGKVVYKSYGSMTYALLRGYVLVGLKADDPRVQATQKWITEHYTVDGNPGMEDPLQGLYYYYLSMAEALSLLGSPTLKLPDGTTRNWARDLGEKIVKLQNADGSWVNTAMRWEENDRVIATSFAMTALRRCVEMLGKAE
jgi:squalene-hopene/tetraprenyl-beta-curcumene cyclase